MRNTEYSEITDYVKEKVLREFELNIKFKCLSVYRKYIHKLRCRQDKNEILTVINVHNNQHLLMHTGAYNDSEDLCCEQDFVDPVKKFDQYSQQVGRLL
jgi:hypothetical protein